MERILFEIAYNGANYHGWQKQNNAITVQETIEKNFSVLLKLKNNINIVGCGRTDTGVHAEQYFFHVDVSKKICSVCDNCIIVDHISFNSTLNSINFNLLKNYNEFFQKIIIKDITNYLNKSPPSLI